MALAEEFRSFYESRDGRRMALRLASQLAPLVRFGGTARFLAIGYPRPFLRGLSPDRFERIAMLATEGAPRQRWPVSGHPNCAAAGHADDLPFSGAMFDQLLMVHALEHGPAADILTEVSRVLAPAGELILVVPNRAALLSHLERSPFGRGHPYGRGELSRLLQRTGFRVKRWDYALHAPPVAGLRWIDAPARVMAPRLGGAHVVVAEKSGPLKALRQRVRARRPVLVSESPAAARAML